MWGKSAVGGTASKSQGGFFYPLDLIVVVSLFPGCRLVFGKNGRCVFKNIGKDCLFRPLSLSLCSGHAGTSCLSSAISQLWPPERSGFR